MSPEYVPCKAESLVNPYERGIIFEHPETGDFIAAIVPVNRVTIEKEPPPGGQVVGYLQVSVEKRRGKSAFIDIEPAEMVQGDAKQKVPLTFITAFKKTPDFQSGDELNADMSSSFTGNPAFQSGEDVIKEKLIS